MKKLFLLFCTILSVQLAHAYDEEYDPYINGIYYFLDYDEAWVICGPNKYSGDVKIPESIIFEGVEYPVTATAPAAFRDCTDLTSIEFPNSFKSIGSETFEGCTNLTSIKIPDSVERIYANAFTDCTNLQSIELPASLTEIDTQTFKGCSSLSSIEIPETVTTIWGQAFEDCRSLTNIQIPNAVTSIRDGAFKGCSALTDVLLPNGITKIEYETFMGCSSLKSIEIPTSVSEIEFEAFKDCSALTDVILPDRLTKIEYETFMGCSRLKSIEIPNNVTTIGLNAFNSCTSLTDIVIPGSVTSISDGAFAGCSALTSVEIPNSVNSIGYRAFGGCNNLIKAAYPSTLKSNPFDISSVIQYPADEAIFDGDIIWGPEKSAIYYVALNYTGDFAIPSTVKTIGEYAFKGCTGLTDVHIPADVAIGQSAFEGCTGLTDIQIPAGVAIGQSAFEGCTGLTDIQIPAGVAIGQSAFKGCTGLTDVHIPADVTIGQSAFEDCSGLKSIELSTSLKTINQSVFKGCTGLSSIVIPGSVTSIGKSAFGNCIGLSKLVYNAENCSGEGFSSESDYHWLSGCSNLKEVEIGQSVKTIPSHAFFKCNNIESVNTSSLEGWTSIDFGNETANPTFYAKKLSINNEPIRRITLPADLTKLHAYAFINCEQLLTVNCGSEITNAESCVFSGCSSLQRIAFPGLTSFLGIRYSDRESILTYNNSAVVYVDGSPLDYSKITEWPESISEIPDFAFYNQSGPTRLTIPATVTSIGKYAFSGCGLSSITINDGLQKIGEDAFSYCYSLNDVIIESSESWAKVKFDNPESNPIYYAGKFREGDNEKPVDKLDLKLSDPVSDFAFYNASNLKTLRITSPAIGKASFANCDNITDLCIETENVDSTAFRGMENLTNIYSLTPAPPSAPDNAFSKYSDVRLYVPQGAISAYENAENCWWHFLDINESDFSDINTIFDPNYTTGVEEIGSDKLNKVYTSNGHIYVETDSHNSVEIWTINGLLIATGYGNLSTEVSVGIYFVRINGQTSKLIAR